MAFVEYTAVYIMQMYNSNLHLASDEIIVALFVYTTLVPVGALLWCGATVHFFFFGNDCCTST